MTKIALGRGFEGLIPTGFSVNDVATPGEHIKQLEVLNIVANPDQPRKEFDAILLNELAQSIKEHGIIQPLVVTPYKDKFRIVAGERRFRAAQIAKLKKIPVIVRNHEKLEELEIALVENVQRVDLSPLEQAISVAKLRDQFSLSLKEISKKLGKAETTVSNIIRLLHLPKKAIEALQKNLISEGHARAILALKTDEKLQTELLNKIITQKLSVRASEQFVKDHRVNKKSSESTFPKELSRRVLSIEKQLGLPVKIVLKKRGGIFQIKFKNYKEINAVLKEIERPNK
jgi:ParB family transcriptional regulator, chromosome partitioning protein